MYDNKEFRKIELRLWMIFMEKDHFKGILKDYCILEGFVVVLRADNIRYACASFAHFCP